MPRVPTIAVVGTSGIATAAIRSGEARSCPQSLVARRKSGLPPRRLRQARGLQRRAEQEQVTGARPGLPERGERLPQQHPAERMPDEHELLPREERVQPGDETVSDPGEALAADAITKGRGVQPGASQLPQHPPARGRRTTHPMHEENLHRGKLALVRTRGNNRGGPDRFRSVVADYHRFSSGDFPPNLPS